MKTRKSRHKPKKTAAPAAIALKSAIRLFGFIAARLITEANTPGFVLRNKLGTAATSPLHTSNRRLSTPSSAAAVAAVPIAARDLVFTAVRESLECLQDHRDHHRLHGVE